MRMETVGRARIIEGDCREVLATLPDASVQMVLTSPPYYNLRTYLPEGHADAEKELGNEMIVGSYVNALVAIFRQVRRVLRDDGTVWLNIGDCYASSSTYNAPRTMHTEAGWKQPGRMPNARSTFDGKPKDLLMVPARVAIALCDDGWYLRADNVWAKPNSMPESVTDRPTKSHEYVFLLSKKPTYYYDHEAVRTAPKASTQTQLATPYLGQSTKGHVGAGVQDASDIKRRIVDKQRGHSRRHAGFNDRWDAMEREEQVAEGGNLRSVWWISPAQFGEGHFAVMPNELAEICIRAGSKPGDTVLDPFCGAGTTLLVADRLQRSAIGIELNPEYVIMAANRLRRDAPLFAQAAD